MKKKITLLVFMVFAGFIGINAQEATTTSCNDLNGYVDSKNSGDTGYYILSGDVEEAAAQTYHYTGPGKIGAIEIHGQMPSGPEHYYEIPVKLKIRIYDVDENNRPTNIKASSDLKWNFGETQKVVNFLGGVSVNNNFAVVVEMFPSYSGQEFHIMYTGDGEGGQEDLPSVAGTSTGGNWISILPTKDGDFYLIPKMQHFITTKFGVSSYCIDAGATVEFTNLTNMTTDRMFNTIGLADYAGTDDFYTWEIDEIVLNNDENTSYTFDTPGAYEVALISTIAGWNNTCENSYYTWISVGLDVSATINNNVSCYGGNNGIVTAVGSGGKEPYKYSLDGYEWTLESMFDELDAGEYVLHIMDVLGCESEVGFEITGPNQILIVQPISYTTATCGTDDGAILAEATGGTGTLEYSLNSVDYQSSGAFNDLYGGFYSVYVKDESDCVVFRNVVVENTVSPTLELQSYTNVSCNGGDDGTITLIGSGGTGALEYSIDGITWQSTGEFLNVRSGEYAPIVRDVAGCFSSLSEFGGIIKITEPTRIDFSVTQEPASCSGYNDGQIDVHNSIGGTGTLLYSLVIDAEYQSGTDFSGLTAGIYTVYVKDIAGCIVMREIEVEEPNAIVVTATATNSDCYQSNNGTITAIATGGNGDYEYSIDGNNYYEAGEFYSLSAGLYTIWVMDGNGCMASTAATVTEPSMIVAAITAGNSTCSTDNGTFLVVASGGSGSGYEYSIDGGFSFNSTGSFSGLYAGTYFGVVVDDSGCRYHFKAIISDSDGPVIDAYTSTDVTCDGGLDGTITITSVSGGTGLLEYSIDGSVFQTSNMFTGLSAGTHTVVVQDANGCTGDVIIELFGPNAISIILTGTDVSCNGGDDGSILISAAGGAGELTYSIGGEFYLNNIFEGLEAGTYTVFVKDDGGCISTDEIILSEPLPIISIYGILNVTCNGDNNGAIYAKASGGIGSHEYSINGIDYQSDGNFEELASGDYVLYIMDEVGCEVMMDLTISEPALLEMISTVNNVSCAGGNDGFIGLDVSGGVTPYTYLWSNSDTRGDLFNLSAGEYDVIVTDANGCEIEGYYEVTSSDTPIVINAVETEASSETATDGAVDITVTGGAQPYSYSWSNGATTEDISGLAPGVYTVVITDANGCISVSAFTVSFNIEVEEVDDDVFMNIFPNPVNDKFIVELGGTNISVEKITLINICGKVVYETTPISNKSVIDVKEYADGVYFIKVNTQDNVLTKKVVISK